MEDAVLSDEHRSAVEWANEAGATLLELRSRSEPGKALGAEGDKLS